MDAMQLAQMKRTLEWHMQEVRHEETELQSAELALEGAKKKVEDLRKKQAQSKRALEQQSRDVAAAENELRRKLADERR